MPDGVDYAVFDFAVNSGVSRAVRTLQKILQVKEDGVAGPLTLAAVTRFVSQYGAHALTDAICQARTTFLKSLPGFARFGSGWIVRVMGRVDGSQIDDTGVVDRAFDMARGLDPIIPVVRAITPKTYAAGFA